MRLRNHPTSDIINTLFQKDRAVFRVPTDGESGSSRHLVRRIFRVHGEIQPALDGRAGSRCVDRLAVRDLSGETIAADGWGIRWKGG